MKIQILKSVVFALTAVMIYLSGHGQFAYADSQPSSKHEQVIELININIADIDKLIKLPGIGKKKAEQIVAYRELNGEFQSIEELANVKGIGPKLMTRVMSLIKI